MRVCTGRARGQQVAMGLGTIGRLAGFTALKSLASLEVVDALVFLIFFSTKVGIHDLFFMPWTSFLN